MPLLAAMILALVPAVVLAAASDLDLTFGAGGIVTTPIEDRSEKALAIAVQPDGKIVAAGETLRFDWDMVVLRYGADGSLDTTFSGDGKVVIDFGVSSDRAFAVAVQPDGKIVLAGTTDGGTGEDFALVRLDANGSLDTTFDEDGKATTRIGAGDDAATAMTLLPDGRILVAGYAHNGANLDFALARYHADGSLDTSFDADGRVTTAIGTGRDQITALELQPDGKAVAAGFSRIGAAEDFALARYNPDGSLDSSFGTGGTVTTPVGIDRDFANALAIQADGKLIAAGYGGSGAGSDFAVARFEADGSLDPTFAGDGALLLPVGSSGDVAYGVKLQFDGKIVLAGDSYGEDFDTAVVRLNPDGSLDPTFDDDGKLVLAMSAEGDSVYGLAVQPDGKIVLAGESEVGSWYDVALARLMGDPPPVTPAVAITAPETPRVPARSFRIFRGTAGPPGHVARVEVALRRADRKAQQRGYCRWLRDGGVRFLRMRDRTRTCATPYFLEATGTETWFFTLARALPKGRYELKVRATVLDFRGLPLTMEVDRSLVVAGR